jgi:protoporphyrin/coproporphyrin ferrochelatase
MTSCPLGPARQCYCASRVTSFGASSATAKHAVLLLAHGSPENSDQVPEFLNYVTGGRPLPPTVVEEVRHRYSLIGFSPLPCWTLLQADGISQALNLPAYVGMRNWKPLIADTVQKVAADGITHAIAICLAPQNSRTSVGLYRKAVEGENGTPFTLDFIESWHDHPELIAAFAEKLIQGRTAASRELNQQLPVVFTAHSVPERTIAEGDPYERQTRETAAMVAKRAGLLPDAWYFAFQSQGMSGGAWLGPTVENTLLALKEKGHTAVFLQPIGFLCDHVEVLYDIDIGFQEFAKKHGMQLWRAESLNESPTLTAALADIARSRMNAI